MINGIRKTQSNISSYHRNAASMQTNPAGFQNRLIDKAIHSDNNLNGQHAVIYMNCLVSQVSGSGQELHMKYDESSTDENPVIYAWGKDSSGNAFETKIFVNNIDPYHASPAEMKALHAHLAKQNGGVKSNSVPIDVALNGYDVNQKLNFVQYLGEWNAMQELAKNPDADLKRLQLEQYVAFYQQNQNVKSAVSQDSGAPGHLDTKSKDDLERLLRTVEMSEYYFQTIDVGKANPHASSNAHNGLDILGPSAPDEVRNAWIKAEEESGTNGYGMNSDGKLTQITALFAMSIENRINGKEPDILGSTVHSAKAAVQKALDRLGIPQDDKEKKEKFFYEAFLRLL